MTSMEMASSKRRRGSSPSGQNELVKRPYEILRRQYGDTYISGSANVQFGDQIYLDYKDAAFKHDLQRLQDSLSFSHMHQRYESLREAADGTFQWITNSNPDGVLKSQRERMGSFFRWLHDGTDLFWIAGKPGSGKSTLMKYLVEHTLLGRVKSTHSTSAVFSYFFWISGTDLQRNKIGCMRSLLWQALQNLSTTDLAFHLCQLYFKGTWTERLLQTVLVMLLEKADCHVAIFLDGLDESNDHDDILAFLDILRSAPLVKLCVSSRPESILVASLKAYSSIELQSLTTQDIRHVIKTTFLDDIRVQHLNAKMNSGITQDPLRKLGSQIELKADGVFLWVILAIKDLLKGITQRDDVMTLFQRLQRLPNDITALYEDLLRRAEPDSELYKNEAALYLSLALHRRFNLVDFCFAINERLRNEYLDPAIFKDITRPAMAIDCEMVGTWVSARTAGLLKVQVCQDMAINYMLSRTTHYDNTMPRRKQVFEILRKFGALQVQFIHRTAHDFLRNTTAGHTLLGQLPTLSASIEQICFETKLIGEAILPGLLKHSLGTERGARILECRNCTDEIIFNCLRNQGQHTIAALRSAELLLPDMSYWVTAQREATPGAPRPPPFPSSEYAIPDFLPSVITTQRYSTASLLLETYCCVDNSRYLTSLLVHLLFRVSSHELYTDKLMGFRELLRKLVEVGADLHKIMMTDIGEVFDPLGAVQAELYTISDTIKEGVYQLLRVEQSDLSTKSWPSCADCHEVWHKNIYRSLISRLEFWGYFCADAEDVAWQRPLAAASRDDIDLISDLGPTEDDMFVLATRPSYKGLPTALPRLLAISEIGCQWFVKISGQDTLSNCLITAPGILGIYLDNQITKASQSVIDALLANSQPLSFAEAMTRLQKSQETIQKFYESEVKRMAHYSEDTQSRWKQWYRGPVDFCGEDSMSTEL